MSVVKKKKRLFHCLEKDFLFFTVEQHIYLFDIFRTVPAWKKVLDFY